MRTEESARVAWVSVRSVAWANTRGVLTSVKENDGLIVCVLLTPQAGENLLESIEGLSL